MSTRHGGAATATNAEIAERIKNALIIQGVNQKELAAETGISYKRLLASLKGERSLTVVEFRKIADAIHVKPSSLLPDSLAGRSAA